VNEAAMALDSSKAARQQGSKLQLRKVASTPRMALLHGAWRAWVCQLAPVANSSSPPQRHGSRLERMQWPAGAI
jgi:hypothetical protein